MTVMRPEDTESKTVEGYGEKLFRVRVGNYRILYEVDYKNNLMSTHVKRGCLSKFHSTTSAANPLYYSSSVLPLTSDVNTAIPHMIAEMM